MPAQTVPLIEADGWTFKRILVPSGDAGQCIGLHAKACRFQWDGIKAWLGCAKPRWYLMLGFERVFSVWPEFHLFCNHEEALIQFVQMLFEWLSRGTGKWLAQPCPLSPSLYTVGQHLGTSGVFATLIPNSSWTGHLWMQNTEEIESWVISMVLLLANIL